LVEVLVSQEVNKSSGKGFMAKAAAMLKTGIYLQASPIAYWCPRQQGQA
jgi:hypothetical protein